MLPFLQISTERARVPDSHLYKNGLQAQGRLVDTVAEKAVRVERVVVSIQTQVNAEVFGHCLGVVGNEADLGGGTPKVQRSH